VIAGKVEGRFWVLTNTRSLELAADSKAAAEMWISVLQQTANKALVPSDLGDMEEEVRPPDRYAIAPRRRVPFLPATGGHERRRVAGGADVAIVAHVTRGRRSTAQGFGQSRPCDVLVLCAGAGGDEH